MPNRDPRLYVRSVPLPIASQKGLKLQARSAVILNPTTPTREEVRKCNYDRRLLQMTEQGFSSCNYKPYKGLGDPIYLDNKKLILHSLGQWDQNEDSETSSSSEDEESPATSTAVVPQTTAKFVLKRTRTNLNTLSKEVVKGRQLIRNVSLGHGLFNIIKQERQAKKAALFAEKLRSIEKARSQWQPPKGSSEEEESDNDEDLENLLGTSFTDNLSDDSDLAFTTTTNFSSFRVKSSSARTQSSRKHKKQVTPRPFTPQHNNLLEVTEHKEDVCRSALFRQLCALYWILDAMNVEQGCAMGPISTCWSHLFIGGSKLSAKKAREERRAEIDWERWLNNQQIGGKANKKLSITRLNRFSRTSRLLNNPRVSLQSRSISPSSSSSQVLSAPLMASFPSQVNAAANQSPAFGSKEISLECCEVTPIEAAEEETVHKSGIFKFLDEYYDSLKLEEEKKKEDCDEPGISDLNQQLPAEDKDQQTTKSKRESRSAKKSKHSQDKQQTPERLSKSPDATSRFILRDLCNNLNIRAKSSIELQEFHANKTSNKYTNLRQDLRDKLKEILDDKAMTLHDVLEQMERVRLAKCQAKYRSLCSRSMDFYHAVTEMRREEHKMLTRTEIIGRQSSIKGNWYTDLLISLPDEIKDIWYYQVIVQKIGKYGLVENTSKQSVYKFLKVLEGLRHWEICSPDISVAIEFCRSKIVEMSVDDYEEWFAQAFPKVLRPKTAPAALRDHPQSQDTKSGSKNPRGGSVNVKKSRSAIGESTMRMATSGVHSKQAAVGAVSEKSSVQFALVRQM